MRNPETRKRWLEANKEKLKSARRKHKLKADYGMTEVQYSEILESQNNRCAICKSPFKQKGNHNEKAHVDHCHSTNKVRGLLCGYCNMGIGKLGDSVEILESALEYLKSSQL